MRFVAVTLTDAEQEQQGEVRAFLAAELAAGGFEPGLGVNAGHSPEFSRKLAARGWLGMSIPAEYGGHGRGPVERFLVVEELLAAGAPVLAHWVADRQIVPVLLAHGTPEQKATFLPAIAAGECFFSVGMSEPDAGSDLASVRARAVAVPGGWSLSGTKIWTSGAHLNHFALVLCRTSALGADRHEGLSQLVVDLAAPGVKINPITFLDGSHHFNEVVFDEVFVPDGMVLGAVGDGWAQVTSELSYERAGPDRYLTSWQALEAYAEEIGDLSDGVAEQVGRLAARCWTIRQLSLSVARIFEGGGRPGVEAAMVKDLGTLFEQEVVAVLQSMIEHDPDPLSSSRFARLLARALVVSPSYTIRGGTSEVLRTVAARSLRSSR